MPYTRDETAVIYKQILSALEYQNSAMDGAGIPVAASVVIPSSAFYGVTGGAGGDPGTGGKSLSDVVAPLGATTDTPVGDMTTVEGATARTEISLLKRVMNGLIAFLGRFGTAGNSNANVLSVQGIASGTALPATETNLTPATTARVPGTSVSATATSASVLALNASRKYMAFINMSDTPITLSLGGTAVVGAGIVLSASVGSGSPGGSYESTLYTGVVNAIHGSTGNKALAIVEI